MPTILKQLTPTAKKEHTCMFCGCKIRVGEKYSRDTLVFDGDLYDWVSHIDCHHISSDLDMFENVGDEGLTSEDFNDYIDQYLYDNYQDEELDDLPEHIRKMSRIEQVRMILNDLKNKED